MSTLVVQVGQCGNQLGYELFRQLHEEAIRAAATSETAIARAIWSRFFRTSEKFRCDHPYERTDTVFASDGTHTSDAYSTGQARCLLVDTEPKVVHASFQVTGTPHLPFQTKKLLPADKNPTFFSQKESERICGTHRCSTGGGSLKGSRKEDGRCRILNGDGGTSRARALTAAAKAGIGMTWDYTPKGLFHQQGGSGNNWAQGFLDHGPSNTETLEGLLLNYLEANNDTQSLLFVHSVAGGTGSGLGAFLTGLARDLLPKTNLFNVCVWPFDAEVAVQAYNACLSLHTLYQYSDGLFIFENGEQSHLCASALGHPAPDFANINSSITSSLIGACLCPSSASAYAEGSGNGVQDVDARTTRDLIKSCPLQRVKENLVINDSFKLLTCRHLPHGLACGHHRGNVFEAHTTEVLLKRLGRMFNAAKTIDAHPSANRKHEDMRKIILHRFKEKQSTLQKQEKQEHSEKHQQGDSETGSCGTVHHGSLLDSDGDDLPLLSPNSLSMNFKRAQHFRSLIPLDVTTVTDSSSSHQLGRKKQRRTPVILNSPVELGQRRTKNVTIAALLRMRGVDINNALVALDAAVADPQALGNLRIWKHSPHPLTIESDTFCLGGHIRSASLTTNCLTPLPAIKKNLRKGLELWRHGAYLFKFTHYGLQAEDFAEAFEGVQEIVSSYEHVTKW